MMWIGRKREFAVTVAITAGNKDPDYKLSQKLRPST
jgi:hypothetical protein